MRLRPLLWALALVFGFWYATSVADWDLGRYFRPAQKAGRAWSEPGKALSAGAYSSDEQNNIEIYRKARNATVNITSTVLRETWFFQIVPEQGTGSGFIIRPDGLILTNYHVVSGAQRLSVTMADDRRQYRARLLGGDPRNDLALIQLEGRRDLPHLQLGDSDHLVVGQKVLAIGNPFGLQGTLTTGVVSSLGRTIEPEQGRRLEDMVQTDAAINPGNSGGPLLDSHGNVIGINTAIYGPQGNIGIGFAMPINRAKAMLDEFQTRGRVTRPYLGVETVHITGGLAAALELPEEGGLLIVRVQRGSAAEEAGLRGAREVVIVGNYRVPIGGDLIMAVDSRPVSTGEELQRVMNRKRAGDSLELLIFRDRRTQKLRVRLGEAPQSL